MPGVSILPSNDGQHSPHSPYSLTHPLPAIPDTSYPSPDDLSISNIKKQAKAAVKEQAQGASALALISAARTQYLKAGECESNGDLKGALSGFVKAASLAQAVFSTKEYANEAMRKEMNKGLGGILESQSGSLTERLKAVEEKLRALEKSTSPDGPISKPGGTIADRLRSLQSNGLSVQTTKRVPYRPLHLHLHRNPRLPKPHPVPYHPLPNASHRLYLRLLKWLLLYLRCLQLHLQSPQFRQQVQGPPRHLLPPTHTPLCPHQPWARRPLHPLPLPHPLYSSAQPNLNYSVSEFKSHFPSIDELDELVGLNLPSVPTGLGNGTGSNASFNPSTSTSTSTTRDGPISPIPSTASALRHFDPLERPSSTPINITQTHFGSRPASPSATSISRSIKPSGLGLSSSFQIDEPIPSTSTSLSLIPHKNTATPRELASYLSDPKLKVLLLDARSREEFERERIETGGAPVVCVEPSVLAREGVTAQKIEDSLVLATPSESTSFANRNKFDLVVLYDSNSESYFNKKNSLSPLDVLQRAIYEQEYKKSLRRAPMVLEGGLEGWKGYMRELGMGAGVGAGTGNGETNGQMVNGLTDGMNGLVANGTGGSSPSPPTSTPLPNQVQSNNPFAVGGAFASAPGLAPSLSSSSSSSPSPSIPPRFRRPRRGQELIRQVLCRYLFLGEDQDPRE
ncbi:hypothetical protein D9758_008022 [Tetrapyrgos nigripes]|uniref:Rhodanese domain-containing protein n=1 Tax=Tetrapyrgos nigripes TaxID=182062 RepID=A0A8H5FWA2_9AGAR|nr:hypothetical protein D9758_008022 [Tetrapyrgos nigripes]